MPAPITLLDYGSLEGGLVRMMDRFRNDGTLIGDEKSDEFIRRSPAGALLGMLFDQRVRAEYAFTGPIRLHERLGHLDFSRIASMDEDALRERFAEKPAVHRFTNKMAAMTQAVATHIVEHYEGDASKLWNDEAPFPEIQKRLRAIPGFGPQKAYKMKFVLHYFGYRDFTGDSSSM